MGLFSNLRALHKILMDFDIFFEIENVKTPSI